MYFTQNFGPFPVVSWCLMMTSKVNCNCNCGPEREEEEGSRRIKEKKFEKMYRACTRTQIKVYSSLFPCFDGLLISFCFGWKPSGCSCTPPLIDVHTHNPLFTHTHNGCLGTFSLFCWASTFSTVIISIQSALLWHLQGILPRPPIVSPTVWPEQKNIWTADGTPSDFHRHFTELCPPLQPRLGFVMFQK